MDLSLMKKTSYFASGRPKKPGKKSPYDKKTRGNACPAQNEAIGPFSSDFNGFIGPEKLKTESTYIDKRTKRLFVKRPVFSLKKRCFRPNPSGRKKRTIP